MINNNFSALDNYKNKTTIKYSDNKEYSNSSRYQILRVINDEDAYLETYDQVSVPLSDDDMYHVVKESEVNRLDIISNIYYGRPDYYWAIALANNFIDPMTVNEGTLLRIPSVITINKPENYILTK